MYARPAVKVNFQRDDDKAFFSGETHVDLDQRFQDYLQSEIRKLAKSKPLKIVGLSEKEEEVVTQKMKVIFTKPKCRKHSLSNEEHFKLKGSRIGKKSLEDNNYEEREELKYDGNSFKAFISWLTQFSSSFSLRGSSINDVKRNWRISDPLPPLSHQNEGFT